MDIEEERILVDLCEQINYVLVKLDIDSQDRAELLEIFEEEVRSIILCK